jgi:hypothetical protein
MENMVMLTAERRGPPLERRKASLWFLAAPLALLPVIGLMLCALLVRGDVRVSNRLTEFLLSFLAFVSVPLLAMALGATFRKSGIALGLACQVFAFHVGYVVPHQRWSVLLQPVYSPGTVWEALAFVLIGAGFLAGAWLASRSQHSEDTEVHDKTASENCS